MGKVKINNKNYNVPELTFGHFTQMEEQGFSVPEAFRKNQMFLIAMGFTCVVVGCERYEAEHLIEQHVLGGGKIKDITDVFSKAAFESSFFKKMLGIEEEKPAKKAEVKNQENKEENESE